MVKMSVAEFKETLKKGNKYKAIKTEYNGQVFDSKKEAEYAKRLEFLKHAHELSERVVRVEYQVAYHCVVKKKPVCVYKADFRVTYGNKRQEVIDVKGFRTDVYRLKKKLVEALFNIKIIEV